MAAQTTSMTSSFPTMSTPAEDLERRNVYLEASRGCPYRCAFCLSALDKKVRPVGERFLSVLDDLYARGLRHFRFVDRTFNLDIDHARAILERFVPRDDGELFLHFEMVPDRLPEPLLEVLGRFRPGAVQLEVGFQTFNEEVARTIDRRTRYDIALANIKRLRSETGVHIHADLIAGLPGEDLESFGRGFDRLFAAGPHEVQLGILKRLKGYPLAQKPESAQLVFSEAPPFEVLKSDALSFEELQGLRRAARVYDLVFNQARYPETCARLVTAWNGRVFDGVWALQAAWRSRGLHKIAQLELAERLYQAMLEAGVEDAAFAIEADYCEGGRRRAPPFLTGGPRRAHRKKRRGLPPRQARHQRQEHK